MKTETRRTDVKQLTRNMYKSTKKKKKKKF